MLSKGKSLQRFELRPERVGVCIIDIQERLSAAMPEKVIKGTLRNCLNLIEAARVLNLPIVMTEQDSGMLGRSLPVVAESVLRMAKDQVFLMEKLQFNCHGLKPFDAWVKKSGRSQWIISGMEAHVSVYQTVRSMVAAGLEVHVPRDAVVARTMANWEIGLQLMGKCGALVTSTETVVFDLLKQAGTEEFGILSRIIK